MRALIVDHQPLFIDGVATVLRQSKGADQIFRASSIDQALGIVGDHPAIDVAVMCVERPVCPVPRAIRDFVAEAPNIPILALVGIVDVRLLREVMRAGAQGIVSRGVTAQTLTVALDKIMSGGRYIPEDLPMDAPLENGHGALGNGATDADGGGSDISHLTPRQRDVLQLLALGQSNQEIAGELGIALATVKLHVNAILRSLKVRNRTEAAAMAIVSGLLNPAGRTSSPAQATPSLSDMGGGRPATHAGTPSVD